MHAKADFRSRDGRYILMRTAARFSNDTGKSLLWKDLPARLDNKVFEKLLNLFFFDFLFENAQYVAMCALLQTTTLVINLNLRLFLHPARLRK